MTENCIRGLQKKRKRKITHPHPLHGDLEMWREGREGTVFCLPNNLTSPQSREQKQASCGVNFYPFQTYSLQKPQMVKWHALKSCVITHFYFLAPDISNVLQILFCYYYYYYYVKHFSILFICLFMHVFIYLFNYFTFGFNVVRPWIHELNIWIWWLQSIYNVSIYTLSLFFV